MHTQRMKRDEENLVLFDFDMELLYSRPPKGGVSFCDRKIELQH